MARRTMQERASRAAWLREVEDRTVARMPALAGRLDWYTAIHLYNQGRTVEQAVDALVAREE